MIFVCQISMFPSGNAHLHYEVSNLSKNIISLSGALQTFLRKQRKFSLAMKVQKDKLWYISERLDDKEIFYFAKEVDGEFEQFKGIGLNYLLSVEDELNNLMHKLESVS